MKVTLTRHARRRDAVAEMERMASRMERYGRRLEVERREVQEWMYGPTVVRWYVVSLPIATP